VVEVLVIIHSSVLVVRSGYRKCGGIKDLWISKDHFALILISVAIYFGLGHFWAILTRLIAYTT